MGTVTEELLANGDIATLPTIATEITKAVNSPNTTAHQIASIVSADQSVSIRILRLINSAFYGFTKSISSIDQAVVILGFNTIKNVTLTISIIEKFKQQRAEINTFQLNQFWIHSLATGAAAEAIAHINRYSKPEDFFTAGLIHDIGKVALYQYAAEQFLHIRETANRENISFLASEKEHLENEDHTTIGAALTKQWELPEELTAAVLDHHTPKEEPFSATVHCADIIVRALEQGNSGDDIIPLINDKAWEFCNLHKTNLHPIFDRVQEKVDAASFLLAQ